jgi:predicted MFS family arabinose efflux permease
LRNVLATVMQRDAPPDDRASVLSLAALLFRLAFVVTGGTIGALVDHAGLSTALGVLAVVFTAAGFVAFAMFAQADRETRA